ncbi:hypothetical protein SAMN04489733_4632 [Amycolatopsis keratiniphila]|nr:hypothetical protein SAMN04489733_4632 [Amycolatopsis keratiniphila]
MSRAASGSKGPLLSRGAVKASLPTLKVVKEAFTDLGSLKEAFTDDGRGVPRVRW